MAKAKVLSPEQTAILEAYADRIATIDPADTFGLLDMGEVLVTVEEQFGRKPMETWAKERCHLKPKQIDTAWTAYCALGPHRHRLEQMDVSIDVVMTLLKGLDEDVDHGIDAMETYGPISVPVLKRLMANVDWKITAPGEHPLLRFDASALQDLITLKSKNGMAIFQDTLARLVALTLRYEEAGLDDEASDKIRLDLSTGAEEALRLFENLALLPHRRINAPEVLHASWPPVASAWTQFDEAMNDLRYLEERHGRDLASFRDVMRPLMGDKA